MLTHHEIVTHARSGFDQWISALPPALNQPMRQYLERRGFLDLPDQAFADELRYPVLGLPLWTAQSSAMDISRTALIEICTAALFGYVHVRIVDDHLDEGVGDTIPTLTLSNALLSKANALLATHTGSDSRFWEYQLHQLNRAAVATLLELQNGANRHQTSSDFEALLDRAAPLTIPAAAILTVGDSWRLVDQIEQFARSCAWASQMLNDLRDVGKDLLHHRVTWAAVRLMTPGPDGVVPNRQAEREMYGEAAARFENAAVQAAEFGFEGGVVWARSAAAKVRRLGARQGQVV